MQSYVTYDASGNLDGAYLQSVHPDHAARHISVPANVRLNWALYRANAARNGVESLPAVAPSGAGVPQSVTRRQARQALLLAGLLDSVVPAIEAIPDAMQRRLAQIEWDDSQTYERQRPLVIQIGAALGLDAAGLDALFVHAATL